MHKLQVKFQEWSGGQGVPEALKENNKEIKSGRVKHFLVHPHYQFKQSWKEWFPKIAMYYQGGALS